LKQKKLISKVFLHVKTNNTNMHEKGWTYIKEKRDVFKIFKITISSFMSSNLPLLVLDVGPIILLYIDIHKAITLVFLLKIIIIIIIIIIIYWSSNTKTNCDLI
jgi:type IV secretory pathway VirB6-like protein